MSQVAQFPFFAVPGPGGTSFRMPYIPVLLRLCSNTESVSALIDSCATLGVFPYDVGLRLGADWNALTVSLPLSGNLASQQAKALALEIVVGSLTSALIVFAWSRNPNAPVLLGQFGFFDEFDVRFSRSKDLIEIEPRP